ncbi:MAG: DUF5667 domain-containing protein, partial [Patescibacteria group bacterium]
MNSLQKQFKDITPNTQWQSSLKSELVSFAKDELITVRRENVFEGFKSYFQFNSFARAMTVASLVLVAVTGSSILTVSASRNSLPGETLYSVKRMSETVQNVITSRPEARVRLKLSFAKERLNEAQQIARVETVDNNSQQKLDQTMIDFQKEIEGAQKVLDEIKNAKGEVSADVVAELAYYKVAVDNNNQVAVENNTPAKDDQGNVAVLGGVEVATVGASTGILAEVDAKAKEYQAIFTDLKQSNLVNENNTEVNKAMEATAKLVQIDPIVGTENVENKDNIKDNQTENKTDVVSTPVVPKIVEPEIQGLIIR